MLVFLGSSYTRGGWGNPYDEIYLSTIVQNLSGYKTLNLATPCYGSEKYLSSFLYACTQYKPKLFFVETAANRSSRYFYVPNKTLEEVNNLAPEEIYRFYNTHGIEDWGRHRFRIHSFSSPKDQRVKEAMQTCDGPVEIKKLLDSFNYVRVVADDFLIKRYRTISDYTSLESLSSITKIPIVYYTYDDGEFQAAKTFIENQVPHDRYLNQFHNIGSVVDYTNEKLNGKHLADECHHNYEADVLFAKDLLIPFVEHYCNKYGIALDKVGEPPGN